MNSNQVVIPGTQGAPAAGRPRWQQALPVLLISLSFVVAPFVSAGTLAWPAGWAYVGLILVGTVLTRLLMARAHPELVAERGRFTANQGTQTFDRFMVPLIALGPTLIAVVAGLDYRFGWLPDANLALQLAGAALVVFGMIFSAWAMVANRFFSSVVRIQRERGQEVVSSGPYRFVRHPGYAGSVPAQFGMALLLGSAWALAPALLIVAVIVARTALEDRLLQAELPGYRAYAGRVRFRLVPGMW